MSESVPNTGNDWIYIFHQYDTISGAYSKNIMVFDHQMINCPEMLHFHTANTVYISYKHQGKEIVQNSFKYTLFTMLLLKQILRLCSIQQWNLMALIACIWHWSRLIIPINRLNTCWNYWYRIEEGNNADTLSVQQILISRNLK